MKRVLIIEDETVLRTSMVRGLSSVAEVVGVGTMANAIAELQTTPPDLVLSDIDLPDRLGIEILGELGARRLNVPVIFMSAYLKAYGAQIPHHANVEVLEKPVSLEDLRPLVTSRLLGDTASTPFALADYLQLACMGHHSVAIRVHGKGVVEIVQGDLTFAADDQGCGVDAFRRLVSSTGPVTCETLNRDPKPRNIEGSWQNLLLDAMRIHDEQNRDNGAPEMDVSSLDFSGFDLSGSSESDDGTTTLGELVDLATEAILQKRLSEAWAHLEDAHALDPKDPWVLANLERLKALGAHET